MNNKENVVKQCSGDGCPFACTDYSAMVQNYGCLPSMFEIRAMRVHHGKTWACHSDPTKPCIGAINDLKENGLPYKVIDSNLITEESEWDKYISVETQGEIK